MNTTDDESQPRKTSRTILKQEIIAGLVELRRPTSGLFLSSLSAGLDIGFSVLLIGVVYTHFLNELGPAITRLGAATAYSAGFILVILGRSELFTAQKRVSTNSSRFTHAATAITNFPRPLRSTRPV